MILMATSILMRGFYVQCAGEGALYGVDINTGGIIDTFGSFVWEPSVVKVSSLQFEINFFEVVLPLVTTA